MKCLVNRIVRIIDSFDCWECIVKLCFLDFLSMAVNIVKSFYCVHGDEIGGHSDVGTVSLVYYMRPEMPISF